MKIVTIVGARPQFIKASVVSHLFAQDDEIEEILIHTGQHFDNNMSEVFFHQMGIPEPKYNLEVQGGHHGYMTGRMMEKIEEILLVEKPNFVLVYGDTNSTLAGALAAKKLKIKVIHVEAGLRSFNDDMPEEVNRIITDRVSSILFFPTEAARENLENEGFPFDGQKLVKCGDVMFDASLAFSAKAERVSRILDDLSLEPQNFVLSTLHRAENTDSEERLRSIVNSLNDLNKKFPVVLPIHPRTRKKLQEYKIELKVKTTDPVGYLDMLMLLKNCRFVMTDSGGVQKEAYFFEKPCLTLRDETEWRELVEFGYNRICGASEELIATVADEYLSKNIQFKKGIYGDGHAANEIKKGIINYVK
ncbi:non-hydrolyzing UDP-N-acetylglucosamine 2-epimerase [Ekhidna sp.]|uniref:non-hydrolyzing UDP-N-acetylglucosamine 2-epimerase n=1 Tax=Ekhidna sp. TaxID=2608089 RepID=UPI003C79925E